MTAAVETMAYAGDVPWHGLGVKVSNKLTPEEMLKVAGIDWTVSKRSLHLEGGAKVPGKFAIVRDSDDKVLTLVGSMWKPVQNKEGMSFFKKFVESGHMSMETAGSLQDGRYIWALANIGKHFKLADEDEISGYLLMALPHKLGRSLIYQFTGVRVVCQNTLMAALGESITTKGGKVPGKFSMPHSVEFNENTKAQAEAVLGVTTEQFNQFETVVKQLAATKVNKDTVLKYFKEGVLRMTEEELTKLEAEGKGLPRMFERLEHALKFSKGADMVSSKGTLWGAFNAVTWVVDHEAASNQDNRLRSAWFGTGARMKRRALDAARVLASSSPTRSVQVKAPTPKKTAAAPKKKAAAPTT